MVDSVDKFVLEANDEVKSKRSAILKSPLQFDEKRYQYNDQFVPAKSTSNPLECHTTGELIECLRKNPKVEISAEILGFEKTLKESNIKPGTKLTKKKISGRDAFLKAVENSENAFKESDTFLMDDASSLTGLVGQDFIPLMGGPFHKQLYIHDYMRMQALAFHAYHHDPFARRAVQIIKDFTLGRGFEVVCKKKENQPVWDAFEKVNDLYQMMEFGCVELSLYGEIMAWWLPNRMTKIAYQLRPGQEPNKGYLPRVRLIDPSMVWEIVTYPEDITRVLYYQIVSPTQYQMYTGSDKGQSVPSTKFIFKQVPAEEIMHFKINTVSNEKRGRSDLYPIFGELKRLRDSLNYSVIALQKSAAWGIDTTVEGSDADLQAYAEEQERLGTIAPAGSEFVHTAKIKREYLSNSAAGKGGTSQTFDWILSTIAAGLGIPINYFGTHLSGGQTRASAIVATEPVAKLFEMRQEKFKRIIQQMSARLWEDMGMTPCEVDVIFPEIITQDRSAKLKDLSTAVTMGWISNQTAGEIAAKELEVAEYDFKKEQALRSESPPETAASNPLTLPGLKPEDSEPDPNSSLTGDQRKTVKDSGGF